jgi:hypothetical protein
VAHRLGIVITTINLPTLLEGYLEQRAHSTWPGEAHFYVVGDVNTPAEVRGYVDGLAVAHGGVRYLTPKAQKELLADLPALNRLIPWRSEQRRNVGYLAAALDGCDGIVALDDDNFVTDDDFYAGHGIVGEQVPVDVVDSSDGWYNVCENLRYTTPGELIVHRGFLVSRRYGARTLCRTNVVARIGVNAGLWTGEPDIDAVTRIVLRPRSEGVLDAAMLPVALGTATYCPFNSQNTAFATDLLPCMYVPIMGRTYRGMRIGRYGDIWCSYFTKWCADAMGEVIAYGSPIVDQLRNDHDLLDDLAQELPGMMLTERLIPALRDIPPPVCSDYVEAYDHLMAGLRARLTRADGSDAPAFFEALLDGMGVWADSVRNLRDRGLVSC